MTEMSKMSEMSCVPACVYWHLLSNLMKYPVWFKEMTYTGIKYEDNGQNECYKLYFKYIIYQNRNPEKGTEPCPRAATCRAEALFSLTHYLRGKD